jgi:hypothetical protein
MAEHQQKKRRAYQANPVPVMICTVAPTARVMNAVLQDIIPGYGGRRLVPSELAATKIVRFRSKRSRQKVRNHGVIDVEEDYRRDILGGGIPLSLVAGEPVSDSRIRPGVNVPEYARSYRR